MNKKDLWVNNFSGDNIGYRLCGPWSGWGITYFQKFLLKEKYIKNHFAHHQGVNLVGGYFKKSELRKVIDSSIDLIFENQKLIQRNHQKAYELNKKYFDFAEEILKLDLKLETNKGLAKLLLKLSDLQEFAHAEAVITTWFVDSDGQDLTNKLLLLTEKYVKESDVKIKVSEAFSLLTTPDKISLLNKEEIESLEILRLISTDLKSKKIILNLFNFDKIPETLDSRRTKKIIKHFNKWQWTPYGYLGPAYKIGDYLKHWQKQISENLDVNREIKEKKERFALIKKQKDKLKKDLKLSSVDRDIFDIAADIVFLKAYRKDCLFHGCFVLDKIYAEVARRKYLSKNQLNVMTYLEIIDLLCDKKIDISEINERLNKDSVIIHDAKKGKGEIKVLSGKKAEVFLKKEESKIEKIVVDKNMREFKGVCACSGYAKGIVKIINKPGEMKKMEEGNVMVSHTTFPSLVPAMKKAVAIVTEDGGITCHAAIVSRELGTPCVTGIKVLTQVLEDGDYVEVNADTGVVTILKKAS